MVQTIREGSYWFPLIGAMVVVTMTGHPAISVLSIALGMIATRGSAVVYVWNPETLCFMYADPEATDQTGYTPDELYAMTVPELTGRPPGQCKAIADILTQGIAASVKSTSMIQRKGESLWRPMLAQHSLMVVPRQKPQILVRARAMMPEETTAPPCVLSIS